MIDNLPDLTTPAKAKLWRLALQIEPAVLHAVVWSTVEDSSLRYFKLPLDPTLPLHKALEEAVYAAPVLLADFARVDVDVHTPDYLVAPAITDGDTAAEALDFCCLCPDGHSPHTDLLDVGADLKVTWACHDQSAAFLARTFRNPAVECHISPLVRYFSRKSAMGNRGKLFVHLGSAASRPQADIIACAPGGRVLLAATRTLSASDSDDALYFVLASMAQCGLDPRADEILLCGDAAMRDRLMPRLRRYASAAMPLIFPSAAFRAGRDSLAAPFPLTLLSLS